MSADVNSALYHRLHRMVRRERGAASTHTCIDCGEKARDWSQRRDTSGEESSHYDPRCRSCHAKYDEYNADPSDEVRRKIGSANSQREWTDESRAKVSTALTGRKNGPRSQETKTKISKALQGRVSPTKGTKHTDEARAKISAAAKERWRRKKARDSVTEETTDHLGVVWENTVDQGTWGVKVVRTEPNKGQLTVWSIASGEVFHTEDAGLIADAIFGPDVEDLNHWMTKALSVIDARIAENMSSNNDKNDGETNE